MAVRHALRQRARDGCAFVLISGASGSGKSSLARAGVMPEVVDNELDESVERWLSLGVQPGKLGENLFGSFVTELSRVLPTLAGDSDEVDVLAQALREDSKLAFSLTVDKSLSEKKGTRLILLVDQLEELFTDPRIDEETASAFAELLGVFARSGKVWVMATIRSDFTHRCQSLPALVRLREGGGEIDLLAPGAESIARVIQEPARLAALHYETREGKSLDRELLREAAEHRSFCRFFPMSSSCFVKGAPRMAC